MSSTSRGSERQPNSAYITKLELAQAIVRKCHENNLLLCTKTILEPSAGTGTFVLALDQIRRQYPDSYRYKIVANEPNLSGKRIARLKRRGADTVVASTFEALRPAFKPDLIIGNPPFELAESHVIRAINLVSVTGHVVKLLPVGFLHQTERSLNGFWDEYPLHQYWPVVGRPSFLDVNEEPILGKDGTKSSDSSDYAIFVWKKANVVVHPEYRGLGTSGRVYQSRILWKDIHTRPRWTLRTRRTVRWVLNL